jgi:hypothetical protein
VSLAEAGEYIDWRITEKTTMWAATGGRKRSRRVACKVAWLGEQDTTTELHTAMTGTQAMRWFRSMPNLEGSESD